MEEFGLQHETDRIKITVPEAELQKQKEYTLMVRAIVEQR